MSSERMAFEYAERDGTIIGEEEFFRRHDDISITELQKQRLIENLEVQAVLALKEFGNRNYIRLEGFCRTFIFKDNDTQELYFKPLEIDIRVFFRKVAPILQIYDMRLA